MSTKFDKFKEALEVLCREHGCMLGTSGYDGLVVFDLREGEEPLYGGVDDETDPDDAK